VNSIENFISTIILFAFTSPILIALFMMMFTG
jgi:hypothetical protein